ncbi:hypothetical protein PG995_011092 [Apiospora arundinis]
MNYVAPAGTKRKFDDIESPVDPPNKVKRRTPSSSPLSEVGDDRLPSAEEFNQLEQERLVHQAKESIETETETYREETNLDMLHEDLENTLAQIKSANQGYLTPEAFKRLKSEVESSPFNSPEPKAPQRQYADAATITRTVIKVVRSSEVQTVEPIVTDVGIQTESYVSNASIQTEKLVSDASIQTEKFVSDASVQTDPIPKKSPYEMIRRTKPLVPSANVITVKCRLRKEPPTITRTPSTRVRAASSYLPSPSRTQPTQVVSLIDDDDDSIMEVSGENWPVGGSQYGNDLAYGLDYADEMDSDEEAIQNVEFYGIQQTAANAPRIAKLLRYQDMQIGVGEHPSPLVGLRLDRQRYMKEISSNHRRDPISRATLILQKSSWSARAPLDEYAAIAANWTQNGYQVLKGFPLVEDVEFIIHRNSPALEPDGDCYWRSVAFCLYGSDEYWDVVKAEHLGYLHHVLSEPRHPRYRLYSEHLNSRFFDTSSVGGSPFKANIWQLLHLAHAWTPAVVSQITADLYNICVIIFTLEDGIIAETNVRGVYNSRHIFLCFTRNCHFQPMTPNSYDPWEFQYPRITVEATAKYVNAPKATSTKQTWDHPWRKEFSQTVMPPVPRLHGCDVEELRKYLGSNPRV